jgi:nondiscriminating aspartyl-tRNA synthetase
MFVVPAQKLPIPGVGDDVDFRGMVHHVRRLKGRSFLHLWVEHGLVQVVCGELPAAVKPGASVRVSGRLVPAKLREAVLAWKDREVAAQQVEILWSPPEISPLDLTKPELVVSPEGKFDLRPLTLRHPRIRAVFRVQDVLTRAFRRYLHGLGFVEIHSPKLVAQGAEGGADLFSVPYFGQKAYLAQSPQLYKELATGAFLRVFEVGPVFRAEPHATRRHLNEYVSLDAEMGPIVDMGEVMAVLAGALAEMFEAVRTEAAAEVELLGLTVPTVREVPAISFARFKARTGDTEPDLSPAEEQALGQESELLFVTGYPSSKRPFYVLDDPEAPGYTHSFDLLFRGMEIVSGGQRIHDPEMLEAKMRARGMDPAHFSSFTMGHRYGLPPHGGFGLGLERLTALLCGLDNLRDAALFPRDQNRLSP